MMSRLLLLAVSLCSIAALDMQLLRRSNKDCPEVTQKNYTREVLVKIKGNILKADANEIKALQENFTNIFNDLAGDLCISNGSNKLHAANISHRNTTTFNIVLEGTCGGCFGDSLFAKEAIRGRELQEGQPRKGNGTVCLRSKAGYGLCNPPNLTVFLAEYKRTVNGIAGVHSVESIAEVPLAPSASPVPSPTLGKSPTFTPTVSASKSSAPSESRSPSTSKPPSLLPTFTPTETPSKSSTPSSGPTESRSPSTSIRPSRSPTFSPTGAPSKSATPSREPSESRSPSVSEEPSVSCVPTTEREQPLDSCEQNDARAYALMIDEQVFGTHLPPLSEKFYKLDGCHPDASNSISGNRSPNKFRFNLQINDVLVNWEDAQALKAVEIYTKLVTRGYVMRVVRATMSGNAGKEVDVVGIVSCFNGAAGQRVAQFMVTDDPNRLRQEFEAMPEGCPNFVKETRSITGVRCLGDDIVDTSRCDPQLQDRYDTKYARLRDWYQKDKLTFDGIVHDGKLRYNGMVGIGFLWCVNQEQTLREPFQQCLAGEWAGACKEEHDYIEQQKRDEDVDHGKIDSAVTQLCDRFVEESLNCTECSHCVRGRARSECCASENHCDDNHICANNFCIETFPSSFLTLVLGWFGEDIYGFSVEGPLVSSGPIKRIPSSSSEHAIAFVFDTTASPSGFFDYVVTLKSHTGRVLDSWSLYAYEDGDMSIVVSGRTGSASGTYEYGSRPPSLSPSTDAPSLSPSTDAPSLSPSTDMPSLSPSTDTPSAGPTKATPFPRPTMRPTRVAPSGRPSTQAPAATSGPLPTPEPSQSLTPSVTSLPTAETPSPSVSLVFTAFRFSVEKLRRPPSLRSVSASASSAKPRITPNSRRPISGEEVTLQNTTMNTTTTTTAAITINGTD